MRRLAGPRSSLRLWVLGTLPHGAPSCANGSVSGKQIELCTKRCAAERLCGSDRPAGDAYIRAIGSLWSFGSQRRREVLRGLSCRQFEPAGADEQKKNKPDQKQARENILRRLREKMPLVNRSRYLRHDRGWPRRADRIADCPCSDTGSHPARHSPPSVPT
jgi:hypothetical protein